MKTPRHVTAARQRGNFVIGLIVGLLVGLALALGVALYIAKVPVPFINKVPQRTAEQDAAEVEKNKNWDPNSALYSKVPRPGPAASAAVNTLPPPAVPPVLPPGGTQQDPASILAGKPPADTGVSTKPGSDALSYFVQAGAFGRVEDAEAQRAKLAMSGYQARVTEREQSGRTVYRVRLGPFDKREEAAQVKEKLESTGVESALVQVQK